MFLKSFEFKFLLTTSKTFSLMKKFANKSK